MPFPKQIMVIPALVALGRPGATQMPKPVLLEDIHPANGQPKGGSLMKKMSVVAFLLALVLPLMWPVPAGAQTYPLASYGNNGCGTGAYLPTFHTSGEVPVLGNRHFRLAAENLPGGTSGILFISAGKANYSFLGMDFLTDITLGFGTTANASNYGMIPGWGKASVLLPIPQAISLTYAPFYAQGIFLESTSPGLSFMWTRGMKIQAMSSFHKKYSVIHDGILYRQYVTSAQRGQEVWQANAVPGFTYVNTQQFSCGGQTNWMIIVRDKTYNIEFVLVPGGTLQMGDVNNMGGSSMHQYEVPTHWVRLEPFLLARNEISQAQWRAVMGTSPWQYKSYVGPYQTCAANYLCWNDANAFCTKLGWRLPSESEWEYASRAGTTTAYNYGSNSSSQLSTYAWFGISQYSTQAYPHQIGTKQPNAFGLHDTHGNVWEWCDDKWHPNYEKAPVDGSSWSTYSSQQGVMRRGACFANSANYCRVPIRGGTYANRAECFDGFRPARSLH